MKTGTVFWQPPNHNRVKRVIQSHHNQCVSVLTNLKDNDTDSSGAETLWGASGSRDQKTGKKQT